MEIHFQMVIIIKNQSKPCSADDFDELRSWSTVISLLWVIRNICAIGKPSRNGWITVKWNISSAKPVTLKRTYLWSGHDTPLGYNECLFKVWWWSVNIIVIVQCKFLTNRQNGGNIVPVSFTSMIAKKEINLGLYVTCSVSSQSRRWTFLLAVTVGN